MQLVIGLGTGRCGTTSLAKLLNSQPKASVTHEALPLLPWRVDEAALRSKLDGLLAGGYNLAGDVGFYYLPYVEILAREVPTARFVCLRRDRSETIASYLKKTEGRNHWYVHEGNGWQLDPKWDPCYPKFDLANKEAALGRYWDDYYAEAERLEQTLEQVRIFEMAALNDPDGVAAILDFVGASQRKLVVGLHKNRSSWGWF